jgi:flagellar biosynthesis protein FlhF
MKIKRYFAPDIRQAIRMVRDEQGPDAVILSNRSVDGGVEIVAAVDYEALLSDLGVTRPKSVTTVTASSAAVDKPVGTEPELAIVDMRRELKSLRGLLEHQLSDLAWGEMGRRHPQRTLLLRRLRELGLSAVMCRRIVQEVRENTDFDRAWRDALALLAHNLPVTNDDILTQGGVVALVGPTGVGKTTTVAKLAARCILRHGARSVALVTTDGERIGAQEQLRVYGKILGAPVHFARDAEDLRAVLAELRQHRLILIDTAGMGQRDVRLAQQLGVLRAASTPVRTCLVLSAAAQFAALEETVRAFAPATPQSCIVTKVDETTSLGGVLSVVAQHRLPFSYVSDGQRVPEDLRPARSHTLVSRAVTIQSQTEQLLAGTGGAGGRVAINA